MLDNTLFKNSPGSHVSSPHLFCFAHAGGNAEDYLQWHKHFSSDVNLVAICLPGTGRRFAEKYPSSIGTLTDYIAREIDSLSCEDYYLFGHSMGAILAFEVALKVKKPAKGLIVSASGAPENIPSARVQKMAKMTDDDFAKEIVFFNGLDEKAIASKEVISFFLQRLRKDFELISHYQHRSVKLLHTPVFTVVGDGDPHVSPEMMALWYSTTEKECNNFVVSGDHFYFKSNPQAIVNVIENSLSKSFLANSGDTNTLII